jgi:hypothetical protein
MAIEHLTEGYYDAMSKARKIKEDKYTKAWKRADKMKIKVSKQWNSGTLTSENARKARDKVDWYKKDAYKKADQAYDKAKVAAKAKQTKVRAETAKGWGQLDPNKKTEKKKTGGVTGSRSFVRRNY